MAANIIFNAKTSRPSVCNAIETILVHKNIAQKALSEIKKLLDTKNVEIRGCETTRKILGDSVIPATEEDYAKEFLDYILAVKFYGRRRVRLGCGNRNFHTETPRKRSYGT